MRRAALVVLSGVFVAIASEWAVPFKGAAHFLRANTARPTTATVPATVTFREVEGRGLLVRAWLNDKGPFTFAIDTGAGLTVISDAVASQSQTTALRGRTTALAGLSGREVSARRAVVERLALGTSANVLKQRLSVAIASDLPAGVDGILDPTDAYSPLGFVIDYPARVMMAFDPNQSGLDLRDQPAEGAIVRWLKDAHSERPFVRLNDGRLALLDTGSEFGLAISQSRKVARDHTGRYANDVGGGSIRATRVKPTTINIGGLVLENVPTDLLEGVGKGAPVILGRDALHPFRLTFDPVRRLIEIVPTDHNR
jgi:predicted aspartyl protease